MALTNPRLQSGDLVMRFEEVQQRAMTRHAVYAVTPSAMSTTTFTAPNVDATFPGVLAVPEDGDCAGDPRQVKSRAATVATVDSPWPSVTGVTRIGIWVLAEIPIIVTTADAAGPPFDVIATGHQNITGEPDSYWNQDGAQLVGISGGNAGRARAVATFTTATGTYGDAATVATAVEDLFEHRTVMKMETDPDISVEPGLMERKFMGTGRIAGDTPVRITDKGHINFEMGIKPITPGSSGVIAGKPPNLNRLLLDMFTGQSDTGGTVVTAAAAVIDMTASALTQGGFLLLSTGQLIQIMSTQAAGQDVATYTAGALNFAAVPATSIAHASTFYVRKQDTFKTCGFDNFRGALLRQYLSGCMASVELMMERDQIWRFKFSYTSGESFEYNVARPVALGAAAPLTINDSGTPVDGKGSRILLDGIPTNINTFSLQFGFKPTIRPSLSGLNQADGCFMDLDPAIKGSFSVLADDDERSGFAPFPSRVRNRKYIQFLAQKGSAPGKTFGVGIPAMHLLTNNFQHVNREGEYKVTFQCTSPDVAGYGAAFTNLPDCAFGWC